MNAQPQTIEEKIAAKIDQSSVKDIAVSAPKGGLSFDNASQAMDFARMMAISSVAVPKHLRGNPGACLAVVIQAIEWRLSPYAVANKSYSVNDRLAFESQLVQAVILQRAPIEGRLKVEYQGEGEQRVCRVWATLQNGDVVDYTSPPRGRITPQNSPLWKTDPDQQQFYYSARALCRRHFPDVLLGIYARDELDDQPAIGPDRARDVTPAPKSIGEKLDALAKQAIDANNAMSEALTEAAPVPPYVADEFAGYIPPEPEHVRTEEHDMFEPIRERARIDAEKRIRRMAPTKLSDEEKEIYLQAFDAHRTAEAG